MTGSLSLQKNLAAVRFPEGEFNLDPAVAGLSVVISAHSHKPIVDKRGDVLFVNPGSAGPRRFTLTVTVGTLTLRRDGCEANIIPLTALQRGRRRTGARAGYASARLIQIQSTD